mgnify:CR=1 FL=1
MGIIWKDDLFLDLKDELNEVSPSETALIRVTNRVAKELAATTDLPTAIRVSTVYFCGEHFEKYAEPSDMKSGALIDVRPRDSVNVEPLSLLSPYRFNQLNAGENVTIQLAQNKEFFKLLHARFSGASAFITACETSLTADGAWTAGTGATNITFDSYNYYAKSGGVGAINFDTSGGTTAQVSFAKTTAIDISSYTAQQRVRFFMLLPTAPTGIEVRWGSDSSNYYSHDSISTQASGESFGTTDWNEIEASRASATVTGTPVDTALDYFSIILTFSGATTDTDFVIDYIKAIKPEALEVEYYSNQIAKTAAGVYSAVGVTVSAATTDLLVALEEWRQLIIDGVCFRYLRMRGNATAKQLAEDYRVKYETAKAQLRVKYPSRRKSYKRQRLLPRLSRI